MTVYLFIKSQLPHDYIFVELNLKSAKVEAILHMWFFINKFQIAKLNLELKNCSWIYLY